VTTTACANCGSGLTRDFCATCGQRVRNPDPTLRDFLSESTQELLSWDGKIPATLKSLFFKPGELTRDFLDGRRARWLHPLRVYLICSLAYFASAPLVEKLVSGPAKTVHIGFTNNGSVLITADDSAELVNSPVGSLIGKDRVNRMINDPMSVQRQMNALLPKSMFLLLPLFALLTWVAFQRAAPRFPAHLYFALHIHAAAFSALMVARAMAVTGSLAIATIAGIAALGYIVWWGLSAFRVVFGASWGGAIGRGLALAIVYGVLNATTSALLFFYTLL
jgi:hypothetical protein